MTITKQTFNFRVSGAKLLKYQNKMFEFNVINKQVQDLSETNAYKHMVGLLLSTVTAFNRSNISNSVATVNPPTKEIPFR